MHGNPSPHPAGEDEKAQRVALDLILSDYPRVFHTIWGLSEVLNAPGQFSRSDAVERAVRDLVGIGLLHCRRGLLVPTDAAVRFDLLRS